MSLSLASRANLGSFLFWITPTKLQKQCRLLILTGLTGIGKTALAEYLASSVIKADDSSPFYFCSFNFEEVQSPDFVVGARQILQTKLLVSVPKKELNDANLLMQRLVQNFKDSPFWLQLDSLEVLLAEDEERGTYFVDQLWLEFFYQVLTSDCPSRCVLTSQALPSDLEAAASRYPNFWHAQALSGLVESEVLSLFQRILCPDSSIEDPEVIDYLKQIGQAYEGHPLVLQVIAGEMLVNPFLGNVKRYWQTYQAEWATVLQERSQSNRANVRSRRLENQVRNRVRQSLERLPNAARRMLYKSSVYRRPVPDSFWLTMLEEESQAYSAFDLLRDRYLIEFEESNHGINFLRQHNLIRSTAHELLKANSDIWKKAEYTAAQMWLTTCEITPDMTNLESVQKYLEAFYHYCEIEDWERAVTILFTTVSSLEKGQLHQQLGIWGYYQEQIKLYDPFLLICRRLNNHQGEVFALDHLGSAYSDLGDYRKAIDYYQQNLTLTRELCLRRDEGSTLCNLGTAYQALNEYQQASEYYRQALNIAQEADDRSFEGVALGNLGSIHRVLGEYQQAIEYYQQSLGIAQEISNRRNEQVALVNLGHIHYLLGNYEQARLYYTQTLTVAQAVGDRKSEEQILNHLGFIEGAQGQHEQALAHHHQALSIAREIGDRYGEGVTLGNVGFDLYCLGDYEQAMTYYVHSIAIAREIGNRHGEATVLGNIGRVFCTTGNPERAIEYHLQQLSTARDLGNRRGEAISQIQSGKALTELERYSDALAPLQSALAICQQLGNKAEESEALLGLAELHCRKNDFPAAQRFCEAALKIAENLQLRLVNSCTELLEKLKIQTQIDSSNLEK